MNHSSQYKNQEELLAYKQQREARERQRRKKLARHRLFFVIILLTVLLLLIGIKGCTALLHHDDAASADPNLPALFQSETIPVGTVQFKRGYEAKATSDTVQLDDAVLTSNYAILINPESNTVVAEKKAYTGVSPASMTKVLTILVAAEQIPDLDDTFTITRDITDYSYQHDCSAVGFLDGETVTVRDLFYGTILPSGADAAAALAIYTSGSLEDFVALMNQKLESLGLSDTAHMTNCVGLYDPYHYCTTYDMAIIMKAALENDICRTVLNARTYTTTATAQHPEGLTISNWFMRRIEDRETNGIVMGAKTGFVKESGNCAVSYYVSNTNVPYIAVTVDTYSTWKCIADHVALYNYYAP